jgi:hypothetical protein
MQKNIKELLNSLQRSHVLAALKRIDAASNTPSEISEKFSIQFNQKRYPIRNVISLALESLIGEVFDSYAFQSSETSICIKVLRRCGFTLIPSEIPVSKQSIKQDIQEVLSLQSKYSPDNTPEMRRRGELIRKKIPSHIWSNIDNFEPIFTMAGYEFSVEGSDGVGRKNVSPWVRIFDSQMSSAATNGWYIVFHFSRTGDYFYLTLGCGATFFHRGSLVALPDNELHNKVAWAKQNTTSKTINLTTYSDKMDLKGNDLSRQFEKAIAFAKEYSFAGFNEVNFWHDLRNFCLILVEIYEKERLGKSPLPLEDNPPLLTEIDTITSHKKSFKQGRGLSYTERVAVELRAMDVTRLALIAEGYINIQDVSATKPFDYTAEKNGTTWLIEVKGTTSIAMDSFFLTANELNIHRSSEDKTILALVSDIELDTLDGSVRASGGKLELMAPWNIKGWSFEPTTYRAIRNNN